MGFRYFTRDRALRHGLTGWVRNLPDGNVEFEAQGTGETVAAFIEELKNGPALSYVSDVKTRELPVDEGEAEFTIRF